jgi:hypothetical protein
MITLNPDIKKLNRKEAFAVVRESLETGEAMPACVLEALYKHFAPSAPKNVKEAWQWAAKAVAVKDARGMLCHLYSDGKRLIGCDGHRLHIVPTALPVGYYDPKTCDPVDYDAQYPDIDRVIPTDLVRAVQLDDYQNVSTIDTFVSREVGECFFQENYLNDAVYCFGNWHVRPNTSGDRLYGSSDEGYQFVIMGIRDKSRKAA